MNSSSSKDSEQNPLGSGADVPRARWWDVWVGPIAIGLPALLIALGGESLRLAARYERTGIANGELWRLITGHWAHLGWSHLVMNLVALAVLALLFRPALVLSDWVLVGALSALGIDAGLYWLRPAVEWYVGLSGVLHGIWLAGALAALRARIPGAVALMSLLAVKLIWEGAMGPIPLSAASAGGPVIVAAHGFGALGGFAGYLLAWAARRQL